MNMKNLAIAALAAAGIWLSGCSDPAPSAQQAATAPASAAPVEAKTPGPAPQAFQAKYNEALTQWFTKSGTVKNKNTQELVDTYQMSGFQIENSMMAAEVAGVRIIGTLSSSGQLKDIVAISVQGTAPMDYAIVTKSLVMAATGLDEERASTVVQNLAKADSTGEPRHATVGAQQLYAEREKKFGGFVMGVSF